MKLHLFGSCPDTNLLLDWRDRAQRAEARLIEVSEALAQAEAAAALPDGQVVITLDELARLRHQEDLAELHLDQLETCRRVVRFLLSECDRLDTGRRGHGHPSQREAGS